ncbi:hypothetical protein WS72_05390 [Burkholderia savannae]|uniref:Uncharacterized protein n=1 Tax=Burkholderia savannae TaxID=1637837 RepID=A0ABR5TBI2_9BURK|nr:hypothetical protein WS72_05390 [Burkholderia savannae]
MASRRDERVIAALVRDVLHVKLAQPARSPWPEAMRPKTTRDTPRTRQRRAAARIGCASRRRASAARRDGARRTGGLAANRRGARRRQAGRLAP